MRAETFDLDEVLRHERINLDGAWHVLAAALPTVRRQRSGHLSLVASVAGFRGLASSCSYNSHGTINDTERLVSGTQDRGDLMLTFIVLRNHVVRGVRW